MNRRPALALIVWLAGCGTLASPPTPPSATDLAGFETVRVTHGDGSQSILRSASIIDDAVAGTMRTQVCAEPLDGRRWECTDQEQSVRYRLNGSDITRMDARRHDTRAVEGLAIGGLGGAAAGFLFGYCVQLLSSSDDCAEDLNGGAAVGLVLGAAGAVIGLGIGALLPGPWVEVPLRVRRSDWGSGLQLSVGLPWR
jgi:hypothetical protein